MIVFKKSSNLKNRLRFTFLYALLFNICILNAQFEKLKWEQDLSELLLKIETLHPNPYHHISKDKFYKSVNVLKHSFSDDTIGNQIRMMKLVSLLRDRHTALVPNKSFMNWLPLSIYKFEDGYYIISTINEYKELLGAKIEFFENTLANDVFERTSDIHPSDNNIGRQLNTYYMSSMDVLNYYNFSNNIENITLSLLLKNGENRKVSIKSHKFSRALQDELGYAEFFGPMDENLYADYVFAYKNLNIKTYYRKKLEEKKDVPHFLRNRRGYWYEYLDEHKIMYMAICYSTNNSRNGFKDFNDFLKKVFSIIDTKPTSKVIVDIRYNPGGDGSITLPLVHEFIKRDSINKKGKIFTIIGRKTYSAAQMIYAEMLKHTNTILVGEPAGAPVNGYGDPSAFTLSNSKMHYQISTVYWQMGHPNDTSRVQNIHIPFVFSGKDYVQGKDRAIEYILSLDDDYLTLPQILIESNPDIFKSEYIKRKKEFGQYEWWKPFDEDEMRFAARDLFDQGFHKKGNLGFEALIEMYPNSWRAYRDYASRIIQVNDSKKAKNLINIGLKINPASSDLLELLKKIKG